MTGAFSFRAFMKRDSSFGHVEPSRGFWSFLTTDFQKTDVFSCRCRRRRKTVDAQRQLNGSGELGHGTRADVRRHGRLSGRYRRPDRHTADGRVRVPDGIASHRSADFRIAHNHYCRVVRRHVHGPK